MRVSKGGNAVAGIASGVTDGAGNLVITTGLSVVLGFAACIEDGGGGQFVKTVSKSGGSVTVIIRGIDGTAVTNSAVTVWWVAA